MDAKSRTLAQCNRMSCCTILKLFTCVSLQSIPSVYAPVYRNVGCEIDSVYLRQISGKLLYRGIALLIGNSVPEEQ